MNRSRAWKIQVGYLVEEPWRWPRNRYCDKDYKCLSSKLRKLRRKVNTNAEDIGSWLERYPVVFSFSEEYI